MAQNTANPNLDALDLKILAALQANCRLTLAELSEHVGLSQSPCLRRWRRLEEDGYITGYTAQVDARKLGRKMMAFVEIKLAIHSDEAIETFERAISQAPQVQECFLMTGQRDYSCACWWTTSRATTISSRPCCARSATSARWKPPSRCARWR